MDFYFWEVLNDKVYTQKIRSVGDLKNYIRKAFQEINTQRYVCKNERQASKLGKLESRLRTSLDKMLNAFVLYNIDVYNTI